MITKSFRNRYSFVVAAVKYLGTHPLPVDDAEFNKECGVGKFS